ncbi:MAG: methyltransferase [Ginsengibacter sp.]
MKVCTDSCLFGAWVANKIQSQSPANILDIGTGTGLLSLMIEQKYNSIIDAIDIDNNAVMQATENFQASPWSQYLHCYHEDVLNLTSATKYEFIISNPPFFENDLLPQTEGKKNSKHANKLNLQALIIATDTLLKNPGCFGILLPYSRVEYFEEEVKKYSLFVNEKLYIRQSAKHGFFRAILLLERKQQPVKQAELSIRNDNNEYTPEFIALLKDYYLYL